MWLSTKKERAELDAILNAKIEAAGWYSDASKLDVSVANSTYVRPESMFAEWASMPRLLRLIRGYNHANPAPIRLLGLGSSVGVGATLPDPATQAPVAKFASYLTDRFGVAVSVYNGSVNGTTLADGVSASGYAAGKTAAGWTPDVVLACFGMNDGMVAQYHAGNTYPGVATTLRTLARQVRADDADLVVALTPHPHSTRTPYSLGATSPSYPVNAGSVGVQVPDSTAAQSVESGNWLGDGNSVARGVRHHHINRSMALTAASIGVAVIDVEMYWFRALAAGEDTLFNPAEYAHPNLAGHTGSYWAAFADWTRALSHALARSATPPRRRVVVKTADEARTAVAVAANDSALFVPVRANGEYIIEVHLVQNSPTTADFRVGMSIPTNGTSGKWWLTGLDSTAIAISGDAKMFSPALSGTVTMGGAGSDSPISIRAHLVMGGSDGTVYLQWSQGTSDAGTTTVRADSYMTIEQIN